MRAPREGIEILNSLLRGEIAATETYQRALAKLDVNPGVAQLRQMHVEHREAAIALRQVVYHAGGKPDQSSGVWGTWARIVEEATRSFGSTLALKALKAGEEQGVKQYESALANELVPGRSLIQSRLLQTRSHIRALDRIMDAHIDQK